MFDVSGYGAGVPREMSDKDRETFRNDDACMQRISDCPSVLSGLSREMRTRMNAIVAFSFLLKKPDSTEKEKEEFSNMIFASCDQIISMFDNFLDSAIIDTGNSKAEPVICNPDLMFRDIFKEFREEIKNDSGEDLVFLSETPEFQCGNCLIDANRYSRMVRSLFQLALYNTKSGYIKAGYYLRDNNLTFYILDTGQGYFKCSEFFSSENLTKSLAKYNDPVLAVNISLVRRLLRILNGSVAVESNRLTGSGIYISIPVSGSGNGDTVNKYINTINTI
ncbi:MAG: HAMP domain-containing histidine kinase [Bacteroidales bacterium]|nr:HAMP domain-containing histidine kinase [Bacteroidales bacterium]